jgi:NADH:ubiquinone oxidoreductase subunit 2 (subunit N)
VDIPPTVGFAGKLLLFGAAIEADYAWLAVVAILNSVLSLAVYLRVVSMPASRRRPCDTRRR